MHNILCHASPGPVKQYWEAMVPTAKQQKPVLRDLTEVSEIISSRVGTLCRFFILKVSI